ncbi:response regulator transcription factor [Paraliobacillus zengyii]|uniref:response regulator transcription factor n=1 Tax=Paraliobacillus zengyii TaxID=2213194 RepID=UPI000DD36CEB|nr:response regulator [Paraliobacillus zengyii]
MLKWKVLIADDEMMIREGIRSCINWEKYEMEVVGEAEDGEEVVQLAIKNQIDLLLIDLNMPIMDGITAMKQVKEQLPQCKMVVISGYDTFHYAQDAIRLQVVDYILKPVNSEKLGNILMTLNQTLITEVNQEIYLKQAEKQLLKNHEQLKDRFLKDWIAAKLTDDEIIDQLHFLGLPIVMPQQYLVVMWPGYQQSNTIITENERAIFIFAIDNIVEEILDSSAIFQFREGSELLHVCIWKTVTKEQITELVLEIKKCLKINVYVQMEDIHITELTDLYKIHDLCKVKVAKQARVSPIVKQAQTYVQQHYQDSSITLEKVAENTHVSTVYVSRMIKQELGISYIALLTQLRINKAADLLKTTNMTIREIAEIVGYETQHYFSTAFKKTTGISPNQFRK